MNDTPSNTDSPSLGSTEILLRARAMLSDPTRWSKSAEARTRNGQAVEPEDDHAWAFCLHVAIYRASLFELSLIKPALARLKQSLRILHPTHVSLFDFNDDPTIAHKDIIALIEHALTATRPAVQTDTRD